MASTLGFCRLLALLSISIAAARGGCLEGFIHHGGSCYSLPKQAASWPSAKSFCQSVGADLAIVETQGEHTFLATVLRSGGLYGTFHGGTDFWLDGTDFLKEGRWIWARTRQEINTTFWKAGQPNNMGGENCLIVQRASRTKWLDADCDSKIHFICEMPFEDIFVVG